VTATPETSGNAMGAHAAPLVSDSDSERLHELFYRTFRAADVAEVLPSFDADAAAADVREVFAATGRTMVGVRRGGRMAGYARVADLKGGSLGEHGRPFDEREVLSANAPLAEAIKALEDRDQVFVRVLGEITGEITRQAVQKPAARMWLFGMITVLEINVQRTIEVLYPGDSWSASVAPGRLEKARVLQAERHRRGQSCSLLDCLQTADKGAILLKDERIREHLGYASRRQATEFLGCLEGLRNSLAHSQEILPEHWPVVLRLSQDVGELVKAARLSRVLAAHQDGRLRPGGPPAAEKNPK
jgi:hypothetical protein